MKNKNIIYLLLILFLLSFILFQSLNKEKNVSQNIEPQKKENRTVPVLIEEGKTYSKLMEEAQVSPYSASAIYDAAKESYDLATIRSGKKIYLTYLDDSAFLIQLMYPINDEEELYVKRDLATTTQDVWLAERKKIDYEIKLKTIRGEISTSLYQNALELGVPEGTVIEFANIFEYAVDYAYDIRTGDKFVFVYEERYRNGQYVMPGRILAGKFINQEKPYFAYYFIEDKENDGYFDENGNSVQKMFLRAPVAFRYISSGFTTGLRYILAFNISTGHRAIDYAAPAGTPIRSVGDGTVTFAGWSKVGFGYLTTIRHNSTYSTNYAHQSKIIVKKGQRVRQGQVIGYVGSTGLSTGPHLHYEMVKNGVKINPLKEVLPPGKPIKEENKERFFQGAKKYKTILNKE